METPFIRFEESNQKIVWILLVGLALGVANYALGVWPSIGQSLVQQVTISLVIGYSLLVICYNEIRWFDTTGSRVKKNVILLLLFCLIGIVGSEVEALVRSFVFKQRPYQLFSSGGIYLFNAILTTILGFMTLEVVRKKDQSPEANALPESEVEIKTDKKPLTTTIPIRQGEATTLYPLEFVIFFEAYDNYSFLYDMEGKKYLCNYSLLFLENRLEHNFLRVHRKYLINKEQIHLVKPHLKGRYVLEFKDKKRTSITSSATYSEVIKDIIKL